MAGSIPASATTDGGLWADARGRLRGNRAAVASCLVVMLLVVAGIVLALALLEWGVKVLLRRRRARE